MSILIKGMEMPKNCLACKLRGDGSDSRYTWDCPFTAFAYTREEGETGRLDDCPLVEVPASQGRLIDADALIKSFNTMEQTQIIKLIKSLIDLQPTVIEAEVTE